MIRPTPLPRSICAQCISQLRTFSTSRAAQAQTPTPPPSAGYTRLTNRGLISVSGIDSTTFLQGLITQNMFVANDPDRRARHTGSYAALLNSQGRILNDAFIYPVEPIPGDNAGDTPSWLLEVDKDEIPKLLKHLKRHKLRSKLKLRALDEGERTVWASWKDKTHAEPRWAAYNLESPISSPFPSDKAVLGCIDTRAPGFGSRLVLPGSEDLRTHFPDETQVEGGEVDLGGYTVRRILHGVAEGQAEILGGSALPLESNMDLARGVDFRKGCYVGQELTIRTHHRGVTRKRIVPVQLYEGDLPSSEGLVYDPSIELAHPPPETNIVKDSKRKGRSAGKFLSGIGNIGLALCRLEAMTDISLTGESAGFDPAQEFKVEWVGEDGSDVKQVKVKAFVPPWTREFIAAGVAKSIKNNNANADEGHRARDYLEQLEEEEAQR